MTLFKNEVKETKYKHDSDLMRFLLLMLKFFDIFDESLLVNLLAVSIARLQFLMVHIPGQHTCRP
jgi:hypothetical protein